MRGLILLSLVLPLALAWPTRKPEAAPAVKQDEKQGEFIGVAMMEEDGTIIMRLRARSRVAHWASAPLSIRRLTPNIKKYCRISVRFVKADPCR